MKTEFRLNLWTRCSNNIQRIKVLLTYWGNTKNVLANTNKLYIMLSAVYILYIASRDLLHVWYNDQDDRGSLTSSNAENKVYYRKGKCPTIVFLGTIVLLNRWKQSNPLLLINEHESSFCAINVILQAGNKYWSEMRNYHDENKYATGD